MLYCMNFQDARKIIKMYQEDITPEKLNDAYKAWDLNCDLNSQDFFGKIDDYFLSHLGGWIFHTFYLKDWAMCWVWSLGTELLERTLSDWMLPFRECWFDSFIIDLILSNLVGMYIGFSIMKWLNVDQHDWFGRRGKKSISEWTIFHSHYKIAAFISSFFLSNIQFLTTFCGANALNFRVCDKTIQITRSSIWVIAGILANKENHDFGEMDPLLSNESQGEFRWLLFTIAFLESLITFKFYEHSVFDPGMLVVPLPYTVVWIIIIGGLVGLWIYLRYFKRAELKKLKSLEENKKKSK